jgi:DNA-binding transcriptional MocR family regulator
MLIVSEQSFWWERYKLTGAGASEIASSVEAAVTAGLLKPGAALPPVRDLAERLGINPNTVAVTEARWKRAAEPGRAYASGRAGASVSGRTPCRRECVT